MSDRIIPMHTLACDWPECEETAQNDIYSGWESYDSAVTVFADPDHGGEWLHTDDGKDYCPKHWHLDDEYERSVGPDPKEEA